jgi:lipopolysaccharide/colanic/teichoic acid biosynthesis glycosyltransferase
MKRLIDIVLSGVGLLILSPLLLMIACLIKLESKGGIFFKQLRVGKNQQNFYLVKFRTMHLNAEQFGQLTVGMRDPRITRVGYFLRRYKLDELPQLLNVFVGEMSMVGPRPEVPKYVNIYTQEQLKVLSVKPGITDWASLHYFNENELLASSATPEETYIQEIMPQKLALNLRYVETNNWLTDLVIIVQTVLRIFKK